jgi:hypothetical protein
LNRYTAKKVKKEKGGNWDEKSSRSRALSKMAAPGSQEASGWRKGEKK